MKKGVEAYKNDDRSGIDTVQFWWYEGPFKDYQGV